jgi:copper(I)-binding protein
MFFAAGLAGALLLATLTPAWAHMGIIDEGCPTGQAFTAGDLTITGGFARATLPGARIGGGYLTIANSGAEADTLTGAASEDADAVQVHQMSMDNGVMTMSPVAGGLDIPAGGSVSLDPMGYHLMIMNLKQPLIENQCLEVTLTFARAGTVPVVLNIAGTAATSAPDGMAMAPADAGGAMGDMEMSGGAMSQGQGE